MSDEIDAAQDRTLIDTQSCIDANSADIPAGTPGDCWRCGEPSPRLIEAMCPACRDLVDRVNRRGYYQHRR